MQSAETFDDKLLQLGVLGFRSDENRNVRVGVFPKREEIFVGLAGDRVVACHFLRPGDLQMASAPVTDVSK